MIERFLEWLDSVLPIKARCGHWTKKCNLKSLYHRAAGRVSVCPKCYDTEMSWNKKSRDEN